MCYNNSTTTHIELEIAMNKNIVLFDMDGTLTEPRKQFDSILSSPLWDLSGVADIGVVTGSDMDYVKQQLGNLMSNHSVRYCLHILPCNGTKWYTPPEVASHNHSEIHSVDMRKEIGPDQYKKLIEILIRLQNEVCDFDIPLTGHFISPRGSMINWCPIGRNATEAQRNVFKKFDKIYKFRKQFFARLRNNLDENDLNNVSVKLGGDTSFDIYPDGWDKTYALRHFDGKNVWFVGDRARGPRGNDYEIFKACEPRSFHTTGPEETVEVIRSIIEKIKQGG